MGTLYIIIITFCGILSIDEKFSKVSRFKIVFIINRILYNIQLIVRYHGHQYNCCILKYIYGPILYEY